MHEICVYTIVVQTNTVYLCLKAVHIQRDRMAAKIMPERVYYLLSSWLQRAYEKSENYIYVGGQIAIGKHIFSTYMH